MSESEPEPIGYPAVVRAATAGDHAAFEQLMRLHDHSLRLLARRMVGNSANDVLQDSYLKIFAKLPAFRPDEGSLRVWLHRVVYRSCLDELRRRRRTPDPVPADTIADAVADPTLTIDLADAMRNALERLSPERRTVVVLVAVLGFDYRDASEVLGVPEGTVASRMSSARRQLREALTNEFEE